MSLELQLKYGQTLFDQLMELVKTCPDSFMYKDFPSQAENFVYRIFSYEIPKTTEFELPGAMDSRGTLFYVNKDNQEAKLLALPMRKFFSIGETRDSQKIDYKNARRAFMKEDGSLLTTYLSPEDGSLKFKSQKQPTFKEYEIVIKSVPESLAKELTDLYNEGICIDLELTTPKNRVFIEYSDYNVHILRARSRVDGSNVDIRSVAENYPQVKSHLVKEVAIADIDINKAGIEGYVIEMPDGTLYKVKTIPYLSMSAVINMQDRSKEKIYMYQAALDGVLDDIKSLYHYRTHSPNFPLQDILAKLEKTEEYAKRTYLELIAKIEDLYSQNKHLERADFANKMKTMPELMPLLMTLYAGKTVDYKSWAVKLYGNKRD